MNDKSTLQEFPIPGFAPSINSAKQLDKYSIKYIRADLGEPADVFELCEIETKGLKGDEIVLLSKDKYVFMDKYFIVLQYVEKNP